jgi:hypothetical protein
MLPSRRFCGGGWRADGEWRIELAAEQVRAGSSLQ